MFRQLVGLAVVLALCLTVTLAYAERHEENNGRSNEEHSNNERSNENKENEKKSEGQKPNENKSMNTAPNSGSITRVRGSINNVLLRAGTG